MAMLVEGLHRKFPALKGIQIDYSWWGWVDVSHDMMPRIMQPNASESVFYAVGYGGNGVSFSAHAGRRMAARIAGKPLAMLDLPIYNSELEYPNVFNVVRSRAFAPFRRFGQRFLYHWYHHQDEKK
jgi:glycine/D-amino acid oxidase-like deaminating enzyme